MFDKLTETTKYFIMLIIYVVYITWWAATTNTVVAQQMEISNKTVLLLDAHITECETRKLNSALMKQTVDHLRQDIDILMDK